MNQLIASLTERCGLSDMSDLTFLLAWCTMSYLIARTVVSLIDRKKGHKK